jgi:hypothetical protein
MSFLTRFRAWWTTRRQRNLDEYAEEYGATNRRPYEETTTPSGGNFGH